jgi:hypothetical protein
MNTRVKRNKYNDITQAINKIADEVNSVLNNCCKLKYFEDIILLYSFIENLLKWLLFVKTLWEKAQEQLTQDELTRLRFSCKSLSFHKALNKALEIKLINSRLYKRVDSVRKERNNVIHQFWVYTHRANLVVLRKKLEKLARVANELVAIFNRLTKKVGVDEVYEIFLEQDEN